VSAIGQILFNCKDDRPTGFHIRKPVTRSPAAVRNQAPSGLLAHYQIRSEVVERMRWRALDVPGQPDIFT